jgi:peptide-methionine (S)-S-oxide reductase
MQRRRMLGIQGRRRAVGVSLTVAVLVALVMPRAMRSDDDVKKEDAMKTSGLETITLGAGCFWCTEAAYTLIEGVTDVKVGYMGGAVENPTYKEVCTGRTGHAEVAQVTFDRGKVDLQTVLKVFWKVHDPTSLNKQGGDIGSQYRSAIFYHSEDQKPVIEASRKRAGKQLTRAIVTEVASATTFYEAEDYHQDYYRNNPNAGYCRAVIVPKLKKVKKLLTELPPN